MKNLKKAELAVIGITLLILCFTAGYFTGRNSCTRVISFDQLPVSPAASTAAEFSKIAPSSAAASASGAHTASSAASASAPESPSPSPSFSPSDGVPATADVPAPSDKLNINAATFSEFVALPGIGDVLAQRIIDYRQQSGGFTSIEQLKNVNGIGDKKFEAIKNMITVG
jgi:competence protein ComEA